MQIKASKCLVFFCRKQWFTILKPIGYVHVYSFEGSVWFLPQVFTQAPSPHGDPFYHIAFFFFFLKRASLMGMSWPILARKDQAKGRCFFLYQNLKPSMLSFWLPYCGNSQFLGSHTSLFLPLCKGFWNLLHDYEICCCFSAKLSKQQINWLLSLGLYHHNRSSFVLCCELACRWWWQCVQLRWCMETTDTSWLHQLVPSAELPQVRACLSPLEPPGLCEEPCVQPSCSVCCDMSPQLRDRWTD